MLILDTSCLDASLLLNTRHSARGIVGKRPNAGENREKTNDQFGTWQIPKRSRVQDDNGSYGPPTLHGGLLGRE